MGVFQLVLEEHTQFHISVCLVIKESIFYNSHGKINVKSY